MSEQAAARQVHCAAGLCFTSSHPCTSCSVMLTVIESTQAAASEGDGKDPVRFDLNSCSLDNHCSASRRGCSLGFLGFGGGGSWKGGALLCIRCSFLNPLVLKTPGLGGYVKLVHVMVSAPGGTMGQKSACAFSNLRLSGMLLTGLCGSHVALHCIDGSLWCLGIHVFECTVWGVVVLVCEDVQLSSRKREALEQKRWRVKRQTGNPPRRTSGAAGQGLPL